MMTHPGRMMSHQSANPILLLCTGVLLRCTELRLDCTCSLDVFTCNITWPMENSIDLDILKKKTPPKKKNVVVVSSSLVWEFALPFGRGGWKFLHGDGWSGLRELALPCCRRFALPSLSEGLALLGCGRDEGVQGVLTLFCSGAAQVCHDDRVVELKEQLQVEEEDGERQEEEVEREKRVKESAPWMTMQMEV